MADYYSQAPSLGKLPIPVLVDTAGLVIQVPFTGPSLGRIGPLFKVSFGNATTSSPAPRLEISGWRRMAVSGHIHGHGRS